MTTTINASNSGSGGLVQTADASGVLALQTAGTTAVTINASQNVGIGTSSPRATFEVTNATNSGWGAIVEKTAGSGTPHGLFVSTGQNSSSNFLIKAAVGTFASSTDAFLVDGTGVLKFNSGYGSAATAYGCRAWVSFNGTGTVAILASGNVSSITDSAVGKYIVNFTTAMPDANYSSQANCAKNDPTNDGQIRAQVGGASTSLQTASACSYISIQNTTLVDTSLNMAAFFR